MHGHEMNMLEDQSMELVQGHSGYMYAWDELHFCWLDSFSLLSEITHYTCFSHTLTRNIKSTVFLKI